MFGEQTNIGEQLWGEFWGAKFGERRGKLLGQLWGAFWGVRFPLLTAGNEESYIAELEKVKAQKKTVRATEGAQTGKRLKALKGETLKDRDGWQPRS